MGNEALDASAAGPRSAPESRRKLSPGPGLAAKDVAAHQSARIHKAMIEIVAADGYRSLKVRDVVRLAEVSTRAFYEHFSSKEDCFLRTYELIARRASRRIIAAQVGEPDWRKRPRLVFEAFARELEGEPEAARLALIEAYAAGEESLIQAWRIERTFEGMFAECIARAPRGAVVPPMVVEGIVAGVVSVSRRRLLAGREEELSKLDEELVGWILCHLDESAAELVRLDKQSVWRDTIIESQRAVLGGIGKGELWPTTGDRALILTAVAKLTAAKGYASLTAPRICAAAGVSRRKFNGYFDDVENCFVATLEQRAGEALAQAARAQTAGRSWSGGVYRAIDMLCAHIAADACLSRVCLADDFPSGPEGVRARERLTTAIGEQLRHTTPHNTRPTTIATEAATGAIWSLFHHHVIRDWALRRQVSATLGYLALTPAIGAPAAVAAIEAEQTP